MISIIISTYKQALFQQVTQSISETIGVEFEIIPIENHAQYSICEAYNMCVEKAKYPLLCFVHEDVLFKTNDWGKRLVAKLTDNQLIGLVGVAGTKFRSTYGSTLGQSLLLRKKFLRGHIFHWGNEYTDFDSTLIHKEIEDVVCIDGVFMFAQKKVFEHCKFDQELLTNFHGYDIDFSMQVFFQNYRVVVDRGILLDHHSSGNYDLENTIANRKIAKKWRKKLPIATFDCGLSKTEILYYDILNWKYFLITAFIRNFKILVKHIQLNHKSI